MSVFFRWLYISIFLMLLSGCGGGGSPSSITGDSVSDPIEDQANNLDDYLSNKSLLVDDLNYIYLAADKRFFGYANAGQLGWIGHGPLQNGTWQTNNNLLKHYYSDSDIWVYRINKEKQQATLIENGGNINIGTVFPIVTTSEDLIKQIDTDHGSDSSNVSITNKTLIGGWIVVNLTDGHSIAVTYNKDNKLYRAIGDTIDDKGFLDKDTWRINALGTAIVHSDVTHQIIDKQAGCYFTRATSASDNQWQKEYKLCGGSTETVDKTPPVITLKGESTISIAKDKVYIDTGASAKDDIDGDVIVSVSGTVDTSIVGVYTLTYTAKDKAGNSSHATRTVQVIEQTSFTVTPVQGNTVEYNSIATFTVQPNSQPVTDIVIPIKSSDETQGIVDIDKLVFTPENWQTAQTVTIRGNNRNPVDDKQNYRVILSPVESVDVQFQGVNIASVAMTGIELSVSAANDLKPVLTDVNNKIELQSQYNGGKTLHYELIQPIDNMSIDPFRGVITYRPDASLAGSDVDIEVKMTDGRQTTQTQFKLHIATTTPVETRYEETSLVITENGNDLPITNADGLSHSLAVSKVEEEDLPPVPEGIVRLTDFYHIQSTDAAADTAPFELSLKNINPSLDVNADELDLATIGLYYIEHSNVSGWNFQMYNLSTNSEKNNLFKFNMESEYIYFIGVKNKSMSFSSKKINNNESQISELCEKKIVSNKLDIVELNSGDDDEYTEIEINYISCKRGGFTVHFIDYDNISNPDENNIVINGGNNQSNGGFKVKYEEAFDEIYNSLLLTTKKETGLDLAYPASIYVVLSKKNIKKNKVWENSGYAPSHESRAFIQPTVYMPKKIFDIDYFYAILNHEVFHYLQLFTNNELTNSQRISRQINGYNSILQWLIEGTARWSDDFIYDKKDIYIRDYSSTPYRPILSTDIKLRKENPEGCSGFLMNKCGDGYKTFTIWKLIEQQCNDFSMRNVLSYFGGNSLQGLQANVPNVKRMLAGMSCDFGNIVGSDQRNTLQALLAYYQYATVKKQEMSLLDSNEPTGKKLSKSYNEYGTMVTRTFSFQGLGNSDTLKTIDKSALTLNVIPATGAQSFKVKASKCTTKTDYTKGKCKKSATLNFSGFSQPLIVSVTTEDPHSFTYCTINQQNKLCNLPAENTAIIGKLPANIPDIYHTHFTLTPDTQGNYGYDFTYRSEEGLPELFVTIVNPTSNPSDVATPVTIASKLSANATSNTNNTTKSANKHKVTFSAAKGKIEAIVHFNEKTLHPTKKVFISLVRSDDEISLDDINPSNGTIIETIEVDTTKPSPFVYTFEGLELTRYGTSVYSDDKLVLYDLKIAKITDESINYTEKLEHQVDMKYSAQTDRFTENNMTGTWDMTEISSGKEFSVKFNADRSIENDAYKTMAGFSSLDTWSVNGDGELIVSYYLYGSILLTTYIHKIIGNDAGCHIISSRLSHGDWRKQYKMCK